MAFSRANADEVVELQHAARARLKRLSVWPVRRTEADMLKRSGLRVARGVAPRETLARNDRPAA